MLAKMPKFEDPTIKSMGVNSIRLSYQTETINLAKMLSNNMMCMPYNSPQLLNHSSIVYYVQPILLRACVHASDAVHMHPEYIVAFLFEWRSAVLLHIMVTVHNVRLILNIYTLLTMSSCNHSLQPGESGAAFRRIFLEDLRGMPLPKVFVTCKSSEPKCHVEHTVSSHITMRVDGQ